MNKPDLRREMRRIRKEIPDKDEKSRRITQEVLDLPAWRNAEIIAIYVSTPEEVSTEELIRRGIAEGKTVAVPKIRENGEMDMIRIGSFDDLTMKNRLSIPEPPKELPVILPETIGCMIVPGLAFDKAGNRLGQGGGYYDRYLPKARCTFIGLAFAGQILEEVPHEETDVSMDLLVTEQGILE